MPQQLETTAEHLSEKHGTITFAEGSSMDSEATTLIIKVAINDNLKILLNLYACNMKISHPFNQHVRIQMFECSLLTTLIMGGCM